MNTQTKVADSRANFALSEPVLYPWDSGPAVAKLQELLRAHGFNLKIDGDFGGITEAAVKTFQRQQRLRIDGVVGAQTWTALKATIKPGTRILHQGHTGGDVHELQGLLQVHGYCLCRDGIFGPKTKQAVIDFQQKHKLKVNGLVDPITWTVLRGGSPLPNPPKQTGWWLNPRRWWWKQQIVFWLGLLG